MTLTRVYTSADQLRERSSVHQPSVYHCNVLHTRIIQTFNSREVQGKYIDQNDLSRAVFTVTNTYIRMNVSYTITYTLSYNLYSEL